MPNNGELAIINQIADELEPKIAVAFRAAIQQLRSKINVNELLAAITSGDQVHVQQVLKDLPTHLQPVQEVVAEALVRGAIAFQPLVEAKLQGSISFDAINPSVVEWMRDNAAALVTNITSETQQALRSVLTQATAEGTTTRDVAEALRDMIGLNERQANALYNYRAGLEEQGVDPDAMKDLVDGYAGRLLSDRADMIARTEIIHAANEGQQQLWNHAAEQGLFNKDEALQEWIATEGACEVCDALDGQQVGLDESFQTEDGDIDQPPEHPRCRCALGLVIGGNA